jgi:poly(A) polymerase/tRNA nucleotidyltransferase (CCA-adding enzyme)
MILFYNNKESVIKSWPLSIPEKKTFIHKNWEELNASVFDLKDPALRFRELESYQAEELIMFTVQNYKQEYVEEVFNHLQLRNEVEIPVSGHDLLEMGVEQGPEIREYLLEVRDQILRRQLSTRAEALEYLKEII